MAHRQRLLAQVITDRERIMGEILEQVMAPHVAQFVLGEGGREIACCIAPHPPLQCHHIEPRIAELLAHDRAGPAETDQNSVHGWKFGHHCVNSPTSRDDL